MHFDRGRPGSGSLATAAVPQAWASSEKTALESDGCQSVDLFRRGRLFFVQSVWESPAHMKAYAHSGMHGRLMQNDATLFDFFHNMTMPDVGGLNRDEAVALWHERHDD